MADQGIEEIVRVHLALLQAVGQAITAQEATIGSGMQWQEMR